MLKQMLNFKPSADPNSCSLSVRQAAIPAQLTAAKYKHSIHMLKIRRARVLWGVGSIPLLIDWFNDRGAWLTGISEHWGRPQPIPLFLQIRASNRQFWRTILRHLPLVTISDSCCQLGLTMPASPADSVYRGSTAHVLACWYGWHTVPHGAGWDEPEHLKVLKVNTCVSWQVGGLSGWLVCRKATSPNKCFGLKFCFLPWHSRNSYKFLFVPV